MSRAVAAVGEEYGVRSCLLRVSRVSSVVVGDDVAVAAVIAVVAVAEIPMSSDSYQKAATTFTCRLPSLSSCVLKTDSRLLCSEQICEPSCTGLCCRCRYQARAVRSGDSASDDALQTRELNVNVLSNESAA